MTQAKPLCCDTGDVLRDLARVKALFQLRTIAAIIGAPNPSAPATLPADANLAGGGHSVPRALGGE